MQTNERFHRPIGARLSRDDPKRAGRPPISDFADYDVVDEYKRDQERDADSVGIISQNKHLSRFQNFNWQFLAFWTAYAAVIFAVGYALI